MTLRSRLAIPIAATALAVAAAATPAVADDARHSGGTSSAQPSPDGDDWGDGGGEGGDGGGQEGGGGGQEGDWGSGGGDGGDGGDWGSGGGDGGGDWGNDNQSRARGRVTAGTLLLRSAPNRGSQVIRTVHRGDIVSIFCKTPGQNVQGNSIWYLLPDGTWAWGSARYIKVLGHKPRWC